MAIQREQIFSGVKSDGSPITPPYAPATVKIKQKKGQPTDRVTLKDKGDFQNEIFEDVRDDNFTFDSNDSKTLKLTEKYGAIFGLNESSLDKYRDEVEPILIEEIKNRVQL